MGAREEVRVTEGLESVITLILGDSASNVYEAVFIVQVDP
jgi:hypothetical protein